MQQTRVVLASDGSEGALRAAQWLDQHFSPDEVQLTILTVSHNPVVVGSPNFSPMPAYGMAMEDAAGEAAKEAAKKTLDVLANLKGKAVVIGGKSIVPAIIDYVKAHPADAIVIGRRGHSAVHNILVGSVSSGLVDHSPIPVWLIPS
ncbi:universal stress protein [Sulfobacillus harzensis]|uniref:Universal stress protein n=1 Tax=Sulfobacillus harzensis TaxID=2729629 RepID=A0A7Y0L4J4_9FIRM|nr:universal stress protein [Sulfobacillus harzensis]NMP23204.1 universal stress protein [Sulfobacillus harzensis]